MGYVHGADGRKVREVMQEQVERELLVVRGDTTRETINIEDAIPINNLENEVELDEENKKRNMKSLKGSIMSKKVLSVNCFDKNI